MKIDSSSDNTFAGGSGVDEPQFVSSRLTKEVTRKYLVSPIAGTDGVFLTHCKTVKFHVARGSAVLQNRSTSSGCEITPPLPLQLYDGRCVFPFVINFRHVLFMQEGSRFTVLRLIHVSH